MERGTFRPQRTDQRGLRRHERVLIAHLASPQDLHRAQFDHWYRLRPSQTVDALGDLRRFQHVAFYEAHDESESPFHITHFARITGIDQRPRRELIPTEPEHSRAHLPYTVLRLETLFPLDRPIVSARKRRVRFLESDFDRLNNAREFNDLYFRSPLEERLYEGLVEWGLLPEREYLAHCRDVNRRRPFPRKFHLDFALFCRDRKLNVEVDGRTYHLQPDRVLRDRDRDNVLQSNRWNVLRFHTEEIRYGLRDCLRRIEDATSAYGGIVPPVVH